MSNMFHIGLWNQGSGAEFFVSTSALNDFLKTQQDLFAKGNHLTSLQIYAADGQVVYSATAHPGSGAQWVQTATDAATFMKWVEDRFQHGFCLTSLGATVLNGNTLYAGVVHSATGAQWIQLGRDQGTFGNWVQDQFNKGFRLTSLATSVLNGKVLYSGVVRPGSTAQRWHAAADSKTFFAWSTDLFKQGYRMTSFSTCVVADQVMFSGVMQPGTGGQFTSAPLPWADFNAMETKMLSQGFRMTALLACEILPTSRTWQILPSSIFGFFNGAFQPGVSCGKVDLNGATVTARADGTWSFYGSVHDNSFWYGDNWALGFVFGSSSHGSTVAGTLGAEVSGPAVDGTFMKSGKDPWISKNWPTVFESGIHWTMNVNPDPRQLIDGIIKDLEQYGGTIIQLAETVAAAA